MHAHSASKQESQQLSAWPHSVYRFLVWRWCHLLFLRCWMVRIQETIYSESNPAPWGGRRWQIPCLQRCFPMWEAKTACLPCHCPMYQAKQARSLTNLFGVVMNDLLGIGES